MSERFSTIHITVWKSADTKSSVDYFDEVLERAEVDHDLDYEVTDLIKEKIGLAGLDCEEDGIHFTFNFR